MTRQTSLRRKTPYMLSRPARSKVIAGAAISCALLTFAACSNSSTPPTQAPNTPDPQHQSTVNADSGRIYLVAPVGNYQEGWADLRNTPDGLSVDVDVMPAGAVAQPAHIHLGSCTELGDVFRSLKDIIGGRSLTVLQGITVADVATGGMSINLHRAYSDFDTYTACGEIPTSR